MLHVVPFDQPRGAQRYARSLVDHLKTGGERHVIATLFEGDTRSLGAEVRLEVARGVWRRLGLDPRALWRLRAAVRRVGADIVVAHGGESAKYAAMSLPRRVPLVYLKIGVDHPGLARRASAALHRFYVRRADVVVAVSGEAKTEVERVRGVDPGSVVVIPNGRDPDVYRPLPGHQTRRPRLVWIGEVDTTKRPEWFIEVVRALRAESRELEAVLVGDGPRMGELKEAAKSAGVEMPGRRDDIAGLLAGADVLVFTGRPPEGMPGVLIEAGLCGLPVVSTRVPGAADVVADGSTGILVDLDDLPAVVAATRALLDDEALRARMGVRARERCSTMFSLDGTAERWHRVFNDLMDRNDTAAR